jgi:hypothetical protein
MSGEDTARDATELSLHAMPCERRSAATEHALLLTQSHIHLLSFEVMSQRTCLTVKTKRNMRAQTSVIARSHAQYRHEQSRFCNA